VDRSVFENSCGNQGNNPEANEIVNPEANEIVEPVASMSCL